MNERVITSTAPDTRMLTVVGALSATERRRRASAWNLRNHPDVTVPERELAIADLLTGAVRDIVKRGEDIGVDMRTIPVEGLIFQGTSTSHPRAFIPQASRSLENSKQTTETPSIQKLLRMSDDEALPLIKTRGDMMRFMLARMKKSQQYVADRMGKSRSWIDKAGRGVRNLDLQYAFEFCDILEIDENHPYRSTLIGLIVEEARNKAIQAQTQKRTEVNMANPLK